MQQQGHFARILVAGAALALAAPAIAQAACTSPIVTSARVVDVAHDSWLDHYDIAVTIANASSTPQPGNTMQFVSVFDAGSKLDARGIPPLAPGASYTTHYTFTRSADAGDGTTVLAFLVQMHQPICTIAPPYRLRF